jgi:hypothetical protein
MIFIPIVARSKTYHSKLSFGLLRNSIHVSGTISDTINNLNIDEL